MIELAKPVSNKFPIEKLLEIRDRFGFFLKPFADRQNEECRERFVKVLAESKKIVSELKQSLEENKIVKEKNERLKLSNSIVDLLLFITKNKFLSAKQKLEISTIVKRLKTMNTEQLVKQEKVLVSMKVKLIDDMRR